MLLYVKDGVLEKVEGDPQQSITKGALPIRMLSLPEYVYSPYRILHPLRRDPARRGDDAAWEQCTWDEAYDLVVENVRRCTEQYGSNSIATFVGTGREAGNWAPHHVVPRVQQPQRRVHAVRLVVLRSAHGLHLLRAGRAVSRLDYASQYPTSYDDPRWQRPEVHPDLGQASL